MKKRKLLLALFCLFTIMASAQNGHLKFMGIPLNGSINEFSAKLAAKGIKISTDSKIFPVGTRSFDGVFMGKKANIYVYYTPSTKIVYRAKACIEYGNEDIIKSLYNETKSLLSDKYYGFEDSGTHNGYEAWELFVSRYPDDKEMVWFRCYGNISLYISKYTDTYPTTYTLHIDYTDQINDDKNDNAKQDDL